MNPITQPTTLPTWFTNANINAKFSAKEIAELLQTSSSFVREHLRKQESFESIGNHKPSAAKPTKYFSKKVVLELITTLPTKEKVELDEAITTLETLVTEPALTHCKALLHGYIQQGKQPKEALQAVLNLVN